MSVVINTNSAATMAATNLATSSTLLQKSLNRLSSGSRIVNPEDDAGGLAVSMKLTSTAHRQAAVQSNLSNSASFLQTQDGALNVVGKVLTRIGELKTMYLDPTKNTSDLANYDAEFNQLQSQLTSLSNEKFNGISLFGTAGLTVGVTADANAGTTVNIGAAALMATGVSVSIGSSPSEWTKSDPSIDDAYAIGGGTLFTAGELTVAFHNSSAATYSSNTAVGSAFTASFDVSTNGAPDYNPMNISAGGASVDLTALLGSGSADHHVAITDDGVNASISIDGGSASTFGTLGTGSFVFSNGGGPNDFHLGHFSLSGGGGTNVSDITSASSLGAISVSKVSSALQDVATLRANNGAEQSRLGFASEVLTTNKANIEAANSRITDVDVAAESTQLARFNILTQAGSAMLSQANQSNQIALKLLG